jgi:hypothetical protein
MALNYMTRQYEIPIHSYLEIAVSLKAICNHFIDRVVRQRGLVAQVEIRIIAKVSLHNRIHQRIFETFLSSDSAAVFREYKAVFLVTDLAGHGFAICADPATDPPTKAGGSVPTAT